jgi:uncharacterized membrane protein
MSILFYLTPHKRVTFEKKLMKLTLFVTTLLVAITAGLMFAYACSVNLGLRRLPDIQYLQAMQEINRAILNPWFLTCFVGPMPLYVLGAWLCYRQEGWTNVLPLVSLSGVIYLVGVFIITGTKNVPLNEALDKIVLSESVQTAIADHREAFEIPWNRFHLLRTGASVASLVLLLWALIRVR